MVISCESQQWRRLSSRMVESVHYTTPPTQSWSTTPLFTGISYNAQAPAEVAAVVREAVESREAAFCVSADIKAAHRLVKIREADWPYICCRADSLSETVWINKTGTVWSVKCSVLVVEAFCSHWAVCRTCDADNSVLAFGLRG